MTLDAELINRALKSIKNPAEYQYFFDHLSSPVWIEPLRTAGFFRDIPSPLKEGGYIIFPVWPESRYLARMAQLDPGLVLDTILQIPETDNFRVVEDLVEAAIKMPPELSVKLSDKAKAWAQTMGHSNLPEKLAALFIHIAKGGFINEALDLAGVLLEIFSPETHQEDQSQKKAYSPPPEPAAHFDDYYYKQVIKKYFHDLLSEAGIRALELLLNLLDTAIKLSRSNGAELGAEDYSYIWRPAVEDDPQNFSRGLKNILVSAVRDAAKQLANSQASSVQELVSALGKYPWKIFLRISLNFLKEYGDKDLNIVGVRLLDKQLFDDYSIRHEYSLLVGDYFKKLTEEQRDTILGWIEQGPNLEGFKLRHKEWRGNELTDEEVQRHKRAWQRNHLAWIKQDLPEDWKKQYEAFVAELGEPPPETPTHGATWVGPTSPKTSEELKKMDVIEVVNFLRIWVPPEGVFEQPSPEGLGRNLTAIVNDDPMRFAERAEEFKGLDPTYVRALFQGLQGAIKQGNGFVWQPVLELCKWIVHQDREIPGRTNSGERDRDPDWGWTRRAISSLFSDGFKSAASGIPIELRSAAWDVLVVLTGDPDPTPEYEATYDETNMDPVTLSINTTRGESMHAVFRYALWVRRHIEKQSDAAAQLAMGFDVMPEVRTVLNLHLDVSQDPSLAIRAVYGEWLPWLVLLDQVWAREAASRIFPSEESLQPYFEAAWDAYIVFCAPYDNVLEVLHQQYTFAVNSLGIDRKMNRPIHDPEERLAEHLVTFYWRGKLSLDDSGGILSEFWRKASPVVRARAIEFMGRSLANTTDDIPYEILTRFQHLWETRLATAKVTTNRNDHKDELKAFGWWFVSSKFDDEWAISQLIQALEVAGKTDPDDNVVEKLVALVEIMPVESVKCLELMAKGDREGWDIYAWRDHAKTILSKALDTSAATTVEDLIHYLGSRGYLEFREILKRP